MPKYRLEPGENLMEFVAKCGINVHDIWNHANNKGLRDRVGNPWLVAPGEEVWVPEDCSTRSATLSGKLREFKKIPEPPIIDVYLGFMDEEVNARLAILKENEDKKSEKEKRPVILIERGKLSSREPILEWRLGNYHVGDEGKTPIREIIHVSPKRIDGAPPGESIAPEVLLARLMKIYMVQSAQDDKALKAKKIVVCKNCGISRSAGDKYCEHCGISNSSNKCEVCGLSYMDYFPSMPGCEHGMSHVWKKCTDPHIHKWKEIECKPPGASHVWVEQTGVGFRRAFDLLDLIGQRKPGGSKSGVPESEAQIGDGPWLSVVRFNIGPDKYEEAKDIRAPIVVIRTPEMGLQPSLMQPYIEFLFKSISGAASQLAAEKAKLEYKEYDPEASEKELNEQTKGKWEWPLHVSQFGAQGSCSAQEKYSPGKIITVIASLFVGVDIDKNGDTWAVVSLCTPAGIYDFVRVKASVLNGDLKANAEFAQDFAAEIFRKQKDEKKHNDLTLEKDDIYLDPNNPYKNAESKIKEGDTLKETIDKIYEIYKDVYPRDATPPGVVTLTVSYFGGVDDKKASDALGIYSVGMEDYHVLRILRSAFCQGISPSTDYPIVLGWRIDRIQCDPKEIDGEVETEFDKYIRQTDGSQGPTALMTAEEYADVIVWGLKGLLTTALPKCSRWNFIHHYWKKGEKWQKLLKKHFWSFTYYGYWKDWTFGGLRELRFKVPNPFHIEIATDLLSDLSKMEQGKMGRGIAGEIKETDDDGKNVKEEIKRLVKAVKETWENEEQTREHKKSKGSVQQERPVRVAEKSYIGPAGTETRKAAIELMEYVGKNCGFDSGKKSKAGKPLLKTWLRPGKWVGAGGEVKAPTTQDLDNDKYKEPKFDGACVDRAFYKSCNMMALQTMAGNLWDIYIPMEPESQENE
jgi:hypothetical protein